ncbi:VOC family protein [Flindersiella endophytica]
MTDSTKAALQPRLVIRGASQAIEFYRHVFGAKEISRYADNQGKIAHAELAIGDAHFNLKDENGDKSPLTIGGSPVLLYLHIDDVDAVAERMTQAGATVVYPIADNEEGGRGGRLRDPFGHIWMISEAPSGSGQA